MPRTVLITGSSSGIGRAAAELFAARGWNVAATAREPSSLDAWSQQPNVAPLRLDVTDESTIKAAVSHIIGRFGGIDVLVNNAGYGLFGALEGATAEDLEAQFRTNVFGLAAVIHHVLPGMRERRSGMIVNVSSTAGRVAPPLASAYHATKFAVEGLSESLRYELSLHGIRVKLVEPGHFKTGFISRGLRSVTHPAYDEAFRNYSGWVHHEDAKAPGPEAVAEAIFGAANDSSDRLRYPVKAGPLLILAAILPDAVFHSLLAAGMTRKPPGSS